MCMPENPDVWQLRGRLQIPHLLQVWLCFARRTSVVRHGALAIGFVSHACPSRSLQASQNALPPFNPQSAIPIRNRRAPGPGIGFVLHNRLVQIGFVSHTPPCCGAAPQVMSTLPKHPIPPKFGFVLHSVPWRGHLGLVCPSKLALFCIAVLPACRSPKLALSHTAGRPSPCRVGTAHHPALQIGFVLHDGSSAALWRGASSSPSHSCHCEERSDAAIPVPRIGFVLHRRPFPATRRRPAFRLMRCYEYGTLPMRLCQ